MVLKASVDRSDRSDQFDRFDPDRPAQAHELQKHEAIQTSAGDHFRVLSVLGPLPSQPVWMGWVWGVRTASDTRAHSNHSLSELMGRKSHEAECPRQGENRREQTGLNN